MLKIGTKVKFESKFYLIHWIYDSGYCEIIKDNIVKLVHISELTILE